MHDHGRSRDSLLVRSSSLFDFHASEFLGPETARVSDEFTWLPQFRCARRKDQASSMHVFNRVIQLQRRSQGLVPQRQRYEKWSISTGISILIDMMRSPARRKKKVRLERFLHHQETNHCLLWPSRARRHRTHRQLKSSWCTAIPAHDRRRRRKATTTRGRTWLTTNWQVFSGSAVLPRSVHLTWQGQIDPKDGRPGRPRPASIAIFWLKRHFAGEMICARIA